MSLGHLTLVINACYEPVNIVTARKALTLVLKGAAVVQEPSDNVVRTPKITITLPSVIRLLKYKRIPRQHRSVSRKGIILRDGSRCQYCSKELPAKDLTMDHVLPKCKGGTSTWENLVACCFKCNNKKGDRTPVEAGMKLLKQPKQITLHTKHKLLRGGNAVWEQYMFV